VAGSDGRLGSSPLDRSRSGPGFAFSGDPHGCDLWFRVRIIAMRAGFALRETVADVGADKANPPTDRAGFLSQSAEGKAFR
jgi:hypothetical protein